jgi:hypothetical protein
LKKEPKNFYSCARGKVRAMPSIVGVAENKKSFGSFLQKRTTVKVDDGSRYKPLI